MGNDNAPPGRKQDYSISLLESLDGEWIKLPLEVMRTVGPAAQTLGGLLRITNKETFVSAREIADRARVRISTCRKHLVTLASYGWIENIGRQQTRRGNLRRTATIKLTNVGSDVLAEFGILPWWAWNWRWSCRAVLSVIMARICSLRSVTRNQGDEDVDLAGLGDFTNWDLSLSKLCTLTGLTRESAVYAKRQLAKAGVVRIGGGKTDEGDHDVDALIPNEEFHVVVHSLGDGLCKLTFHSRGGRKVVRG